MPSASLGEGAFGSRGVETETRGGGPRGMQAWHKPTAAAPPADRRRACGLCAHDLRALPTQGPGTHAALAGMSGQCGWAWGTRSLGTTRHVTGEEAASKGQRPAESQSSPWTLTHINKWKRRAKGTAFLWPTNKRRRNDQVRKSSRHKCSNNRFGQKSSKTSRL